MLITGAVFLSRTYCSEGHTVQQCCIYRMQRNPIVILCNIIHFFHCSDFSLNPLERFYCRLAERLRRRRAQRREEFPRSVFYPVLTYFQPSYIISAVGFRTILGSPPCWMCQVNLFMEVIRRHPDDMPEFLGGCLLMQRSVRPPL